MEAGVCQIKCAVLESDKTDINVRNDHQDLSMKTLCSKRIPGQAWAQPVLRISRPTGVQIEIGAVLWRVMKLGIQHGALESDFTDLQMDLPSFRRHVVPLCPHISKHGCVHNEPEHQGAKRQPLPNHRRVSGKALHLSNQR